MPPDLYSEFLHLPPGPRPPNHYEMLALPLFEPDAKVIHAAVLRQTAELKRWALHPDWPTMLRVQEMLNEVGRAGFVLENPRTKADYDRLLAERPGIRPFPSEEAPSAPFRLTAREEGPAAREPATIGPAEPPRSERTCPACGARMLPYAVTCPVCGHGSRQDGAAKAREPRPQEESGASTRGARRRPGPGAAALGVLLGAALLGAGVLLGRAAAPAPPPVSSGPEMEPVEPARVKSPGEAPHGATAVAREPARTHEGTQAEPRAGVERPTPKETPAAAQPTRGQVYTEWPFDAAEAKRRQEETARALGVPGEKDVDLPNGVKLTLVLLPAGEFDMGSPADESPRDEDEALARITISQPFWIGKYEITQRQWEAVMGSNPSRFKGVENPVETVSWADAQEFVRRLSSRVGAGEFALPTDAQWEYACRAGTATRFHVGQRISTAQANYAADPTRPGERAGHDRPTTTRVGAFPPNAWGLHDMHGNVWEWCRDSYGGYPPGAQEDPKGPVEGTERALRGGSWGDYSFYCRSAYRYGHRQSVRGCSIGFRAVFLPGPR